MYHELTCFIPQAAAFSKCSLKVENLEETCIRPKSLPFLCKT